MAKAQTAQGRGGGRWEGLGPHDGWEDGGSVCLQFGGPCLLVSTKDRVSSFPLKWPLPSP